MKKIKKIATWFLFNGLMWWTIYLNFIENNNNMGNIVLFVQWITFFMSGLVLICYSVDDKFKKIVKKHKTDTPKILHNINDLTMCIVFSYYGWFCTAIATFIVWLIQLSLYFNNDKNDNGDENESKV